MGFRSIVSLFLFVLPIGITLGLLLGWDAERQANHQQPLFVDNSVSKHKYCQREYGISPASFGQTYTLNPNQWHWHDGDPGGLCMTVYSHNNNTYPTKTTAPAFEVTWQYPEGPTNRPVHAFPNIMLDDTDGSTFPRRVRNVNNVHVDVEWSYGLGSEPVKKTNVANLNTTTLHTNVAIDMFLDSDKTKSQSTLDAKYEVMVWLAVVGDYTWPVGFTDGPIAETTYDGVLFLLFYGPNGLGQTVFTWVAQEAIPKFSGNVAQFITSLDSISSPKINKGVPRQQDYLGYLGFGSEALWTLDDVTFNVPHLQMSVK